MTFSKWRRYSAGTALGTVQQGGPAMVLQHPLLNVDARSRERRCWRRCRRQDQDFHRSRAASGFCLKCKARLHCLQDRGIQLRVQLLLCCAARPRVSATRVLAAFARAW